MNFDMFFPWLLTIAGAYFLIRNILLMMDDDRLRSYLATSPKGKIWLNKYGMDKTVQLSKSRFLPLGIAISLGMLGVGVYSLARIYL